MREQKIPIETPDNNQKIWRYMDFSKYVDLLTTNELHFTRADKLEDIFDCSYVPFINEISRRLFSENPYTKKQTLRINDFCRLFVYLNCWHINDVESAALWKLYSENKCETIAIKSTFGKLKYEICQSRNDVYFSKVRYDPEHAGTPVPNNPTAKSYTGAEKIIYKRKSFEHEKELRAFIYNAEDEIRAMESKNEVEQLKIQHPDCIRIKIKPSNLIEMVYVSPLATDLFVELVKKVSGDLKDRVLKSNLYELY
jgi:hypothetical protein